MFIFVVFKTGFYVLKNPGYLKNPAKNPGFLIKPWGGEIFSLGGASTFHTPTPSHVGDPGGGVIFRRGDR